MIFLVIAFHWSIGRTDKNISKILLYNHLFHVYMNVGWDDTIFLYKKFSQWRSYLDISILCCYHVGKMLHPWWTSIMIIWHYDIVILVLSIYRNPNCLVRILFIAKKTVWTFQAFECMWMIHNTQIETFLFSGTYDQLFILDQLYGI